MRDRRSLISVSLEMFSFEMRACWKYKPLYILLVMKAIPTSSVLLEEKSVEPALKRGSIFTDNQ